MIEIKHALAEFGADVEAIHAFADDGPDLLPYATLMSARASGNRDLEPVVGVYEWQGSPLVFLVDGEALDADRSRLQRIRRLVAMRGDAPYLGVVYPGRLDVFRVALDALKPDQSQLKLGLPPDQKWMTFAYLANVRPGAATTHRKWIFQVVLKLLGTAIDSLKTECQVGEEDAISLVGRALFTRFLADRGLIPSAVSSPDETTKLFSDAKKSTETSSWLDETFNGDFLPLSQGLFHRLPERAFKILGDVLHRAIGGQLALGWAERWDNLDFAHIPVGVLSQAYELHLRKHAPKRQRKEGGYYTPRPIADLMIRGAFAALHREGVPHKARVLDPAAGAGVFLLTAFRQLVVERWLHDRVRPDTETLREILYGQIAGFDVNEAALRFAALGLYLYSIELDPHPEPIQKLRFRKNLRGVVLHKVGTAEGDLGSLGPAVSAEHNGQYDLVIGNPPWAGATGLPNWNIVEDIVAAIGRTRLPSAAPAPEIPNEVLDLPFIWRAMEWAKPGAQIAFALHARLLFQQGDGMPQARRALFAALDVTAIVNGSELRHTKVWPEISAPFCILYARNQVPPPGAGFRLVNPHVESSLNNAGGMRIDASSAELVTSQQVADHPEILKILFRGGRADLNLFSRIRDRGFCTLEEFWKRRFGVKAGRPAFTGNGYQALRDSSPIAEDGKRGYAASFLREMRDLTSASVDDILIKVNTLPMFNDARVHRRRDRNLYRAPLLIVHKSPPAGGGRIRVAIAESDLVFNETYYGYSAKAHPQGLTLVRYLALVLSSKIALWVSLITSGEFGFEREVIEKTTIDQIVMPDFEGLTAASRDQVDALFQVLVEKNDLQTWDKVDRWVANLYGLESGDLQVINDTLEFNLPFAKNVRAAQARPDERMVKGFCETLEHELVPWGDRFGRQIEVLPGAALGVSPWRSLIVSSREKNEAPKDEILGDWPKLLFLADQLAATEVYFSENHSGRIQLGRLNQARYWTKTQARVVARRLAWDHVDSLAGRSQ